MKVRFAHLILISFFLTLQTYAFTLNNSSNLRGWSNGEVTFVVNTSGCPSGVDVVGLIKSSIKVWNNVPTSSLKISYGGSTSSTTDGDPVVVYCESNFQAVTGADQNYVPAAARGNGTSELSSGLLILNASAGTGNIGSVSGVGLKTVIVHEIGHVLGLGHSQTSDAVMYYTYSYKTRLNLAQDDIDGITYLYPSKELNNIAGCGTIKNVKPLDPPTAMAFLIIFLLPLLAYFGLKNRYLKI